MYLYGASGHAKVIIDILQACNEPIQGLFDDNLEIKTLLNYPVLSPEQVKGPLIISIGHNKIRKEIAESLRVSFSKAVHPSSILSPYAKIERGTVIMQGTILQSDCRTGKHCIINSGSSIDHDCLINDYVHIAPHATLCGNVTIGEGTLIGAGSVIIPGIHVGKWSIIGAGSVVTEDIPDYVIAVGNKCRVIKSIK
ncbi:MAG: acetyltransferase [Bacteroides sp.]|nr:acetyltransferase [Bacteroides sp.]